MDGECLLHQRKTGGVHAVTETAPFQADPRSSERRSPSPAAQKGKGGGGKGQGGFKGYAQKSAQDPPASPRKGSKGGKGGNRGDDPPWMTCFPCRNAGRPFKHDFSECAHWKAQDEARKKHAGKPSKPAAKPAAAAPAAAETSPK